MTIPKIPDSEIIGKRFCRLTVLGKGIPRKYKGYNLSRWECLCDCGNIIHTTTYELINGKTKSCGCYVKDILSKLRTKHGLCNHPLYHVYHDMIDRCYRKKNKGYKNYGERGITVAEIWRSDFVTFYNWAIANNWKSGFRLDRIDVNGNYEPSNCRFVDVGLSGRNKRLIQRDNTTNYRGVTYYKANKKWAAQISINNKHHYLGLFGTPEEAARTYDAKASEANIGHPLNFPN